MKETAMMRIQIQIHPALPRVTFMRLLVLKISIKKARRILRSFFLAELHTKPSLTLPAIRMQIQPVVGERRTGRRREFSTKVQSSKP